MSTCQLVLIRTHGLKNPAWPASGKVRHNTDLPRRHQWRSEANANQTTMARSSDLLLLPALGHAHTLAQAFQIAFAAIAFLGLGMLLTHELLLG